MALKMPDDDKRWFGPHRLGFGWGPIAWQGWAIVGVTVLAAVVLAKLLLHR